MIALLFVAHDGAVRGVAVDGLNQVTVTGGADCCVKVWNFKKHDIIDTVKLDSQISSIKLHRDR